MTTSLEHMPSGPVPAAEGGVFSSLRFIVVVIVLALAATGLNYAVSAMKLYFMKEPVPMRMAFGDAMPTIIGDWVQIARDDTLDPETRHALGTDQYLFCYYVNASRFGMTPQQLYEEKVERKKQVADQKAAVVDFIRRDPAAVLSVNLTYYTGKADTVAHIPERCYTGGGYETNGSAVKQWTDGNLSRQVRFISFEPQDNRATTHVAYLFHTNGRYESDSLTVRHLMQDLRQRHAYYAKIEMSCQARDSGEAERSMIDFLLKSQALMHIEKALPEWKQYGSGAQAPGTAEDAQHGKKSQ